jgi:hypothetical protein
MTNHPSAEQVALPTAAVMVPERLLNEGEIVILAIKPSIWFVAIVSWQVIAVGCIVPLAAHVTAWLFETDLPVDQDTLNLICLAAMAARLCTACLQWMGRLYVLTNLRVLRIKGLLRPDVWSCLLTQISEVRLWSTALNRLIGLGSLQFIGSSTRQSTPCQVTADTAWIHIAQAARVQQIIQATISKLK